MKLQLEKTDGLNTFTAYGEGYVSVNGVRHNCNLAVLPDRLLPNWTLATFATLSVADLELLASLDAEIILLGTGNSCASRAPSCCGPWCGAERGWR